MSLTSLRLLSSCIVSESTTSFLHTTTSNKSNAVEIMHTSQEHKIPTCDLVSPVSSQQGAIRHAAYLQKEMADNYQERSQEWHRGCWKTDIFYNDPVGESTAMKLPHHKNTWRQKTDILCDDLVTKPSHIGHHGISVTLSQATWRQKTDIL